MFCRSCGKELPDNALVCTHCGVLATKGVDASTSGSADAFTPPSFEPGTHPYQKLGGFLAFIVYSSYVGSALLVIAAVFSAVQLIRLIVDHSSYLGLLTGAIVIPIVFALVICLATAAFSVWWATLIKRRNPVFLKVFHYYFAGAIALGIVVSLLTGGFFSSLSSFVGAALIPVLWTLYFVRSVRVRTYFGSDEYVRLSPFTQHVQAALPATARF